MMVKGPRSKSTASKWSQAAARRENDHLSGETAAGRQMAKGPPPQSVRRTQRRCRKNKGSTAIPEGTHSKVGRIHTIGIREAPVVDVQI